MKQFFTGAAAACLLASIPLPALGQEMTRPAQKAAEQRALVDGLGLDEMQEAIRLLRNNYVNPGETDEKAVTRATLSGLLKRLDNGALLVPVPRPPQPPANAGAGAALGNPPPLSREEPSGDFRSEIFPNRTGYVRLGGLTKEHVGELDKALKDFASAKLPATILDLRGTSATNTNGSGDYELAAEVARRFVAKGRPLFTLKKPAGGGGQDQLFTTNADPLFSGRLLVVADADTTGAAEVVAAVLRADGRALVVGAPTAGQAVEYADFTLGGNAGALLRVAVAQIVLAANNASVFPGGVKPDLPANTERADKLAMFKSKDAVTAFVFDAERPHFNEAALVAGLNPELDAARDAQARRREGLPPVRPRPHDIALQRAVDLLTALDAMETKS